MAVLVTAIHVFLTKQGVDHRDKPGDDTVGWVNVSGTCSSMRKSPDRFDLQSMIEASGAARIKLGLDGALARRWRIDERGWETGRWP